MTFPLRSASRAFVLAMITSLVADGLLAALTEVTSMTGSSRGALSRMLVPIAERGRWVVLAFLFIAVARWSARAEPAAEAGEDAAVWRLVGVAVMVTPLLWIAAAWLVQAVLFTLAGRWDIDGQIFLAPDYYRSLLIAYIPWFLGGVTTVMVSRHVS
jgi:hypothetical protein